MTGSVDSTLRLFDLADEGRFLLMSHVWRLDKRDESRERRGPVPDPDSLTSENAGICLLGPGRTWTHPRRDEVYQSKSLRSCTTPSEQQGSGVLSVCPVGAATPDGV